MAEVSEIHAPPEDLIRAIHSAQYGGAVTSSERERPGANTLRGDHMYYGRVTKNSKWDQAREQEPKDYDISKGPVRDLRRATYRRIANVTDGSLPSSTYQDHTRQIELKPDFTERQVRVQMLRAENSHSAHVDRETGLPQRGFGAALPHHEAEHDRRHLDSTYLTDYTHPTDTTWHSQLKEKEVPENSIAYKHNLSQFTDTANHRRSGWNTWQDESGRYANSHLKHQLPQYQLTRTVPEQLE